MIEESQQELKDEIKEIKTDLRKLTKTNERLMDLVEESNNEIKEMRKKHFK
jgi:ElaB/YqjD/DUF883 family membrane-anchored ribosome-binding protein